MSETKEKRRVVEESEFRPDQTQEQKGGWPKQTFHVSHLREEDFKSQGLRSYALSRDLGFAKATGGMVQAHVNRRARPFNAADVSIPHYHDTQFQMVYVLKGWVRTQFEGQGEITMREGSAWIQPPRIKHVIVEYSDDLEVLEIIIPAEYATVNVDNVPGKV